MTVSVACADQDEPDGCGAFVSLLTSDPRAAEMYESTTSISVVPSGTLNPSRTIRYSPASGLLSVTTSTEVAVVPEPTCAQAGVHRKTNRSTSDRMSDALEVRMTYDDTPAGRVTSNDVCSWCATVGRWVWVLASEPPPTSRPVK